MGKIYFVYVLRSRKDGNLYIGHASDLEKRIRVHNQGRVRSTKSRTPFELIYKEIVNSREDAITREKFLKSGCGREYIKNQINVPS